MDGSVVGFAIGELDKNEVVNVVGAPDGENDGCVVDRNDIGVTETTNGCCEG